MAFKLNDRIILTTDRAIGNYPAVDFIELIDNIKGMKGIITQIRTGFARPYKVLMFWKDGFKSDFYLAEDQMTLDNNWDKEKL